MLFMWPFAAAAGKEMQGLKKIIQSNIQQTFGTFGGATGGGGAQGGQASPQQSPLFGGESVPSLNTSIPPANPNVGSRFNALI